MPKTRITPFLGEIKTAYEAGETGPSIAKRYGFNVSHLIRVLRREGVAIRKGGQRPLLDRLTRFRSYMGPPNETGCVEYLGSRHPFGYGLFGWEPSHSIGAHRASYMLFRGPIGPGLFVRHTCDNPPCVNPEHLELGTGKDNMRDCRERGRTAKGERQHLAIMAEKVLELRALYEAGASQVALAKQFGISQPTVSQIVRRVTWKHL